MAEVACVLDCRDQLGESPVWCPVDRRLYWLDIKGQSISWLAPATGEYKQVPVDEQPGSLVLREQGGMVVAFYGGFRFFDPETGAVETIHEVETDQPESRMNDGRCDRQGRFWAGSMDDTMTGRPLGSLYRLDHDLSLQKTETGIVVSNSIAFSPEGETMYYADLDQDVIWGYDLDTASGAKSPTSVSSSGPVLRPASPTAPPSMPRATSGTRAGTAGASPASRPTARWTAPSRCPSSRSPARCSAAPDLDVLYVTGARVNLSDDVLAGQEQAGSIFAVTDTGCTGLPEPRFKG